MFLLSSKSYHDLVTGPDVRGITLVVVATSFLLCFLFFRDLLLPLQDTSGISEEHERTLLRETNVHTVASASGWLTSRTSAFVGRSHGDYSAWLSDQNSKHDGRALFRWSMNRSRAHKLANFAPYTSRHVDHYYLQLSQVTP